MHPISAYPPFITVQLKLEPEIRHLLIENETIEIDYGQTKIIATLTRNKYFDVKDDLATIREFNNVFYLDVFEPNAFSGSVYVGLNKGNIIVDGKWCFVPKDYWMKRFGLC
jgi:hypothetical protein